MQTILCLGYQLGFWLVLFGPCGISWVMVLPTWVGFLIIKGAKKGIKILPAHHCLDRLSISAVAGQICGIKMAVCPSMFTSLWLYPYFIVVVSF